MNSMAYHQYEDADLLSLGDISMLIQELIVELIEHRYKAPSVCDLLFGVLRILWSCTKDS